jgi:hypothetical protein
VLETYLSGGRRRRGKVPAATEIRDRAMTEIAEAPDPFGRTR